MRSSMFHVLVLLHHCYVLYLILVLIDFSQSDDHYVHNVMRRFRWRYFTGWNFSVQTFYFLLCVAENFLRLSKKNPQLQDRVRRVKDFIFTSLFFPGTLYVTLMFWGLYLIDRELVFPSAMDAVLPAWINHSMHTVITVALVVEMRITRHRYSKRSLGLAALALYITAYDILFFNTFLLDGTWLYPIFHVMNWSLRTIFSVVSIVVIFGFYVLGERLSSKLVAFELQRINEKLHTTKLS